jgi:hypothetical protein
MPPPSDSWSHTGPERAGTSSSHTHPGLRHLYTLVRECPDGVCRHNTNGGAAPPATPWHLRVIEFRQTTRREAPRSQRSHGRRTDGIPDARATQSRKLSSGVRGTACRGAVSKPGVLTRKSVREWAGDRVDMGGPPSDFRPQGVCKDTRDCCARRVQVWWGRLLPCASPPPCPRSVATSVGVRRVPVPAGGDRSRGSLVSAVRPVLPGCGGVARRAWGRGGPRDGPPVGPAVHPAAGRGRPAVSARGRGPLVRRRDLPQGRRQVAVCVPGSGPVRAGHRRVPVLPAGRRGGPPVPPPGGRVYQGHPGRHGHRHGRGLPAGARRAGPGGLASHRPIRQQPA